MERAWSEIPGHVFLGFAEATNRKRCRRFSQPYRQTCHFDRSSRKNRPTLEHSETPSDKPTPEHQLVRGRFGWCLNRQQAPHQDNDGLVMSDAHPVPTDDDSLASLSTAWPAWPLPRAPQTVFVRRPRLHPTSSNAKIQRNYVDVDACAEVMAADCACGHTVPSTKELALPPAARRTNVEVLRPATRAHPRTAAESNGTTIERPSLSFRYSPGLCRRPTPVRTRMPSQPRRK